jgi:hypothetical protein
MTSETERAGRLPAVLALIVLAGTAGAAVWIVLVAVLPLG